jgi:cytoskeleton protein RodZ
VDTAPPQIESLHSRRPLTAPFSDARHLPPNGAKSGPPVSMMLAAGVAVVAILAFAAYRLGWMPMHGTPPAEAGPAAGSGEQTAGAATSAPVAATPEVKDASATAAPAAPSASLPAPANGPQAPVTDAAPRPTTEAANVPAPAATPATAPTPAPADKPAAPASGQNTLVLKLRDTSWIEIRRTGEAKPGTSGVLMSHIARAGTTETFEVTEPVAITIGNATGIEATFRGQPLNIKPGPKTNVARLNLK